MAAVRIDFSKMRKPQQIVPAFTVAPSVEQQLAEANAKIKVLEEKLVQAANAYKRLSSGRLSDKEIFESLANMEK